MQVATDLGKGLANAATSLASQAPSTASDLELPVATQGTEQWAGVVAKALTAGGMSHADSLQALQGFKSAVAAKMAKTVSLQKTVCVYTPQPLRSPAFRCHPMSWPECENDCAADPAELSWTIFPGTMAGAQP